LKQNKNNIIYRQVVNDALLVAQVYESLVLKTFLSTRSQILLSSANESVLQVIVKNLLPLRHCIPELALVMDGKKSKGNGCFGFSNIFVLKGTEENYICLELKYISLVRRSSSSKA
jgi:hypothetical protein